MSVEKENLTAPILSLDEMPSSDDDSQQVGAFSFAVRGAQELDDKTIELLRSAFENK
jgi:hypothetical protein